MSPVDGSISGSKLGPGACWRLLIRMLTDIMDELLNLGLHAPVAELNLAQLIGTHERSRLGCRPRPVISQWPSACFDRAVEPRVLFCFVLSGGHGIPHDVDGIWRGFSPALSKPSPCSDLCPSHPKRLGGKPLTDRNMRLRTGACWWLPTKVTAGAPPTRPHPGFSAFSQPHSG